MELLIKTPIGIIPNSQVVEAFKKEGLELTPENCIALETETDIWETDPDKGNPYLRKVRSKTRIEVLAELENLLPHYLGVESVEDVFDYLHGCLRCEEPMIPDFPEHQWIACFVVKGGSEGHYLHIETIDREGIRKGVFLGKTFLGPQKAWEAAQACAIILQA